MKHIILFLAVFLCLSNSHTYAAKDVRKTFKGFQLLTNCEPMYLVVSELSRHNSFKIDLFEKSIQNATESRLRSARLYSNKVLNSFLSIEVAVVGQAYTINIEFSKKVDDPFTGSRGLASTWTRSSVGTHANNSEYILSSVSKHIDEFLVEYLRVNDKACRKKH